MRARMGWILVLAAVAGLAVAALNCEGDKHSSSARDPIWHDNPPPVSQDFCHDTRDNDGDGLADAAGVPANCTPGASCIYEPDPECQVAGSTGEADCSDNLDNDGDGRFDKTDPGCYLCGYYDAQLSDETLFEGFTPECCDGEDNDCDEDYDFADSNCGNSLFFEGPLEEKECNDGVDNDTDGLIDLADPQCNNNPCDDSE